eukprot:866033-Amphidinium_carterae.1
MSNELEDLGHETHIACNMYPGLSQVSCAIWDQVEHGNVLAWIHLSCKDTSEALAEDQKFFADLAKNCKTKAAGQACRTKLTCCRS